MKKKLIAMSILTACMTVSAQGGFFNHKNLVLSDGSGSVFVAAYVADIYDGSGLKGVRGGVLKNLNRNDRAWSAIFSTGATTYNSGDSYMHKDPNPVALLHGRGLDKDSWGSKPLVSDADFDGPTTLLVSNGSAATAAHNYDMDNLEVTAPETVATPIPGAVLLGMFGVSIVGVKLRKYA